jgi:acetylglutamate kinase
MPIHIEVMTSVNISIEMGLREVARVFSAESVLGFGLLDGVFQGGPQAYSLIRRIAARRHKAATVVQ